MNNAEQLEADKCIYCLTEKQQSAFDTEHVLPRSFGNFKEALTLKSEVCKSCNSYFGGTTDRILSRDSYEAFLRLRYGLKPTNEYHHLPYYRLIITIPDGQDDWSGVKVAFQPPYARLIPQLGFRLKKTEEYMYFTSLEVKRGIKIDDFDVDEGAEVKVISNTHNEYEELISFLKNSNIPLGTERKFSPVKLEDGKLNVNIEFIIDTILARGIAKIGFNYMAKVCGAAFAWNPDFHVIRQFIRYGELPPGELGDTIKPSNRPLFANDTLHRRRFGHILCLQWDITRRHVLAEVSLFNSLMWTMILARDFSGLFREIKHCHFYDIQKLIVNQLPVISRELVP
jgi:HNH endonuclease